MQADFERELSAKIGTRRLIIGCLALTFFALFILCMILREASKEVITLNYGLSFLPTRTEIRYNEAYVIPIVLGLLGTALAGSFLIADFSLCGYRTLHKDGHDITIFRGMTHNSVYIDGQERGRIGPLDMSHVVEVWLPNRVRVTVSFSRAVWYMAHVSFSDDTASREV